MFGHDGRRGLQRHPMATGIDSGCVHGGGLTAHTLPGHGLLTVPANRTWCSAQRRSASTQRARHLRHRTVMRGRFPVSFSVRYHLCCAAPAGGAFRSPGESLNHLNARIDSRELAAPRYATPVLYASSYERKLLGEAESTRDTRPLRCAAAARVACATCSELTAPSVNQRSCCLALRTARCSVATAGTSCSSSIAAAALRTPRAS